MTNFDSRSGGHAGGSAKDWFKPRNTCCNARRMFGCNLQAQLRLLSSRQGGDTDIVRKHKANMRLVQPCAAALQGSLPFTARKAR